MPSIDPYAHLVVRFVQDMTLRWSCRPGDLIFWFRASNIFATPESAVQILDFWEMRDGDFVTLTNRVADLPAGFDLHPTEVTNSLVDWMMKRFEQGYRPQEIIEGPTLWRLKAGDRVAWVGESRPGQQATDHILAILDLRECALACAELTTQSAKEVFGFVAPARQKLSREQVIRGHRAVQVVRAMGVPNVLSEDWTLG